MQPGRPGLRPRNGTFQSSSGLLAGCNDSVYAFQPGHPSFNPHPARRPDATPGTRRLAYERLVSILIRPEGRMQHAISPTTSGQTVWVSILIRPEGRMQPGVPSGYFADEKFQSSSGQKAGCNPSGKSPLRESRCFNPHPARRPDATAGWVGPPWQLERFNPHPARRPDATPRCSRHDGRCLLVSILIRPEGRMQHGPNQCRCPQGAAFNPHPARRPDATLGLGDSGAHQLVSILIRPEGRMQSAAYWPETGRLQGFNPHPARRPDATSGHGGLYDRGHVSILIRPEGRMQPASTRCQRRRTPRCCFNPHPARRPDATR